MNYYVVDAFADRVFKGNPAGVCVLKEWISVETMKNIAAENNLSETAFVVRRNGYYDLRWFTPKSEVDLCGHATLGTSYAISRFLEPGAESMEFHTVSGVLTVKRDKDLFTMDFPVRDPKPVETPSLLERVLGVKPLECLLSRDLFVLLESEQQVRNLKPDFTRMEKLPRGEGVIVTARGSRTDIIARCFYPKFGVPEDAVTGSAHCNLVPFWVPRLNKTHITSEQASRRGGLLDCKLEGDRVKISGRAALYLMGEILCDHSGEIPC